MNDLWANLYCQNNAVINNRKIWLFLINSSIGNIAIVDYEQHDLEIKRKVFTENYDSAENYFETVCKKILSGKI